MRKVIQKYYNNESGLSASYKTQTTLMGSAPRAIVDLYALRSIDRMTSIFDSTPQCQYFKVRNVTRRRWITIRCDYGETKVRASIVGNFGIHPAVVQSYRDYSDVYTVTHLPTGLSLSEFASRDVAIQFTKWLTNHIEFEDVAQRAISGTITAEDRAVIDCIKMRRLHSSYIPTEGKEVNWITKNAPWWFDTRTDTRYMPPRYQVVQR